MPSSFLGSLRRNVNVKPRDYWPVVLHSCAITQQISAISIFSSIFILLFDQRLEPSWLILISLTTFILGFVTWVFVLADRDVFRKHLPTLRNNAIKSSILVLIILMTLSPVLRTLTASTSSDSVWPLAGILFGLNALLADYEGAKHSSISTERLSSVISINAALSASVVLASRLPDDPSVFALILLSLLVFGQLPILRSRVSKPRVSLRIPVTVGLSIFTVCLALCVSILHAFVSAVLLLFITFGVPQTLIWAQRFKNEIRGPWDVASPSVASVDNIKSK